MANLKAVVEIEGLHDVDETAALLGTSRITICRWLRDDKIMAVRVGDRVLICECEINRINAIRPPNQGPDILDMEISEI